MAVVGDHGCSSGGAEQRRDRSLRCSQSGSWQMNEFCCLEVGLVPEIIVRRQTERTVRRVERRVEAVLKRIHIRVHEGKAESAWEEGVHDGKVHGNLG